MRIQSPDFRAYIFIIAAIVITAAEILYFSSFLPDNSTLRLRGVLFTADAALLYLLYWFVNRKLRAIVVLLNWILSIYLISNLLYFKYWGDMYSLSSIFRPANYNSFVFKATVNLWSWPQTLMLASSVVITALYIILKPQTASRFSLRIKFTAFVATAAVWGAGFYLSARSISNWHRIEGHPEHKISEIIAHRYDNCSMQIEYFRSNGMTGYIIAQIVNYPHSELIELSEDEHKSIEEYINASTAGSSEFHLAVNRGKNLIFIIVESLNSWVIDSVYSGHELTPCLNRLLREDGTVSCTNMYAQIGHGGSSDGQLIYNTGMLPVSSGVTVQDYISATYPSIVKALKPASSAEFIVENAMVYNHRASSEAFGYDSIFDEHSLASAGFDRKAIGADCAVFSFAFDRMQQMPQPFVAEITTLSMHYPFDIEGFEPVAWIDSVAPDNYYLSHYLQTVHYTDKAIGEFISRLKDSDLWDNSIVVIASDHDSTTDRRTDSKESLDCFPITFMALNTDLTLQHDKPMGQIDVFPTVLDLMGLEAQRGQWRGLGKSLLANDAPRAAVARTGELIGNTTDGEKLRMSRAFTVSDSIIRSDYFGR